MMLEDNTNENEYCVEMVETTMAPYGAPDVKWHRYVIGKGTSRIEGKKPGSLQAVTEHAETIAVNLNLRKARSGTMYVYGKQR